MPELEEPGLSRVDVDRAHSMADEGGASAAYLEAEGARREQGPWSAHRPRVPRRARRRRQASLRGARRHRRSPA